MLQKKKYYIYLSIDFSCIENDSQPKRLTMQPLTNNLAMLSLKRIASISISILFLCNLYSCYQETVIDVIPDFSYEGKNDDYEVPATIIIENNTIGANVYLWTFEGGTPGTSDKKNPGEIRYTKAGNYTIRLEAWNDFHHSVKEVKIVLDSLPAIKFTPEILINSFVPAEININNQSSGVESYEWFFEGGIPDYSKEKNPPSIKYNQSGVYEIILKATSGRKTYTSSKKIILSPALETDFSLRPFFESEDMEVPWKGNLTNKTTSGINYKWSSTGGTISNDTAYHTEIVFEREGKYIVTLTADNIKQKSQKSQEITIKPNSNLYQFENVKLGINTASIGCFFSSNLRNVLSKIEVNAENGKNIDFVFFGLNSGFNYWTFLSPDKVQNSVFDPIPNAIHTKFIFFPEKTNIPFSIADFDKMTNDNSIKNLSITSNLTEQDYFTNIPALPKLILLETDDRRKGAIKIKEFVEQGKDSYIVVDIKIQKDRTRMTRSTQMNTE